MKAAVRPVSDEVAEQDHCDGLQPHRPRDDPAVAGFDGGAIERTAQKEHGRHERDEDGDLRDGLRDDRHEEPVEGVGDHAAAQPALLREAGPQKFDGPEDQREGEEGDGETDEAFFHFGRK